MSDGRNDIIVVRKQHNVNELLAELKKQIEDEVGIKVSKGDAAVFAIKDALNRRMTVTVSSEPREN